MLSNTTTKKRAASARKSRSNESETTMQPEQSTMRQRIEELFNQGELPKGEEFFALLIEDEIARYVWYRAIDYVLWRIAQGRPLYRPEDRKDWSPEIEDCFVAARERQRQRQERGEGCRDVKDATEYSFLSDEVNRRLHRSIQIKPRMCEKTGTVSGILYRYGEGDDIVSLFDDHQKNMPDLYVPFQLKGMPLGWLIRVLPNILTLLSDPRIQERWKAADKRRWSKEEQDAEMDRILKEGAAILDRTFKDRKRR